LLAGFRPREDGATERSRGVVVMRKVLSLICLIAVVGVAGFAVGAAASSKDSPPGPTDTTLPGFTKVVFLSHVNDPKVIPGFPATRRSRFTRRSRWRTTATTSST
jgi:hypothetical protein